MKTEKYKVKAKKLHLKHETEKNCLEKKIASKIK